MHPILFQIGSFTVYSYGFFVALAVGVSFFAASRRAKLFGLDHAMVTDLIFMLFISGVIGARLFYVLQHFQEYRADFWRAFYLQEGGLVWYGGFLFAATTGVIYAAKRRWPVLTLCDFFSPILPLAHAIGRLGCFFNGCCFGRCTVPPWGITFPYETSPRIPTQLYESALLLLLSAFLFRLSSRKKREGEIFVLYLFFYALLRFGVEFFRGDQVHLAGLTPPQWTSAMLLAGAAFLFLFIRRKNGKT